MALRELQGGEAEYQMYQNINPKEDIFTIVKKILRGPKFPQGCSASPSPPWLTQYNSHVQIERILSSNFAQWCNIFNNRSKSRIGTFLYVHPDGERKGWNYKTCSLN